MAGLVASSPGALDTLQELAAALGNDPNFATTMVNALAGKAAKATTLGGYGITDAPTKTELNAAVGNMLSKSGGTVAGSILLNNSSNDSPEIGWQTPGFDIRVDAVNKSLRFFATSDGETVLPLVMDVPNKLVSLFGNVAWHAGNFNPDTKANKATTLAGYGITDAVTSDRIVYSPNAPGPLDGVVGTLWLQYEVV